MKKSTLKSKLSSLSSQRRCRLARFEMLETRDLLSISMDPIANLTVPIGAPVPVGLSGDTDAAGITYTVTSTNPALSAQVVNDGGRSLKLSVQNYGDMVFHLLEQDAPKTTGRIIQLAQQGFYNGLTFHRVIKNFMIQGGDPTGTGTSGSGVQMDDEFNANDRFTNSGVLAMAKSLNDTNDSQFFVTAAPTRWLDFHHTVFGYLTKGDSVLQAIDNVPTDSSDKPTTPVVITSATVFNDTKDGVLTLKAAPGATGDADVTVTATNASGESVQKTFHVTFQADTATEAPFLGPINPIETTAGQPVTIQIPATDVQGHTIYYGGQAGTSNLGVNVGLNNGTATVTPNAGAAGVGSVKLYVSGSSSAISSPQFGYDVDSQAVPVYIKPAAPTVALQAASDTGVSDHDGITQLNNATGKTLKFQVNGAVAGAEVKLFVDGQLIGQTTVPSSSTSGSVVIETTPGQTPLADGVHQFTAQQTLKSQAVFVGNLQSSVDLASAASSPLAVTVDTQTPSITSTPVTQAKEGEAYVYNIAATGTTGSALVYSLLQAPNGMTVPNPQQGQITWMPNYGQAGTYPVKIQVADQAGNSTTQDFQVTVAQGDGRLEYIGNNAQAHQAGWTWKDPDGDTVMPVFSGPGYAELQFDGSNKLQSINLHGTSRATSLSLVVTRGGNGTVEVGRVTSDGALGSLNLASANLFGTGIELAGPVNMVFLNDVADNAKLDLGGQSGDSLWFNADRLGSNVDLTFGGTVTYARVGSWTGGNLSAADVGVLQAMGGNLGAKLQIDATKNPTGGFDWIGVFGGDFTGSVDVPGAGGAVMVFGRQGQGGNVNSPNSFHVGGNLGGVFAFGGTATLSLNAGGRVGPIMALGGDVHFTGLNVASGGLNVMALGTGSSSSSYQGGDIRIDGDNPTVHGNTWFFAHGGDLQLPAQMTIDGDVTGLYANRITSATSGAQADLKVLGQVFALTADWLSADIETDSLVTAHLAKDNLSATSATGQQGSIHVKNRNGSVFGANGRTDLSNDSDGVIYTSPA